MLARLVLRTSFLGGQHVEDTPRVDDDGVIRQNDPFGNDGDNPAGFDK